MIWICNWLAIIWIYIILCKRNKGTCDLTNSRKQGYFPPHLWSVRLAMTTRLISNAHQSNLFVGLITTNPTDKQYYDYMYLFWQINYISRLKLKSIFFFLILKTRKVARSLRYMRTNQKKKAFKTSHQKKCSSINRSTFIVQNFNIHRLVNNQIYSSRKISLILSSL